MNRVAGRLLLLLLCGACCFPTPDEQAGPSAPTPPTDSGTPAQFADFTLARTRDMVENESVEQTTVRIARVDEALLRLAATDARRTRALSRRRTELERHRRDRYAAQVDSALIEAGIETDWVRAEGRDHDHLVIRALCGRVWMDRIVRRTRMTDAARALNFVDITCRSSYGSYTIELDVPE